MKPKPDRPARPAALSKREIQILNLVGLSDKKICEELGLSRHTVKNHWRHIYRKLRAHSRAQAAITLLVSPQCPIAIRFE
jgi:DNA-binding NarL/FixJ family response regulator